MEQNSWSLRWCFTLIKRKLWLIIIITLIVAGMFSTIMHYSESKIKTEYEVSATLLIKEPGIYTRNQTELSNDEYQAINKNIMNHFINLIKMEIVVDEVIDKFQLDMNYEEFREKMNVELINSSNMLKVQIKNEDIELAEKIVDEFVTVSSEKVSEILGINNIEIIDKTQISVTPTKSNKKRDILISAILGVLASLSMVFLSEYMNKTVKSLRDIELHLGLPVVKVLEGSNGKDQLVVNENPDSFSAEIYRNAILNMILIQKEGDIKTMLFTSPDESKDKSKITANLAITLSRTGKKVLLIDGDLRDSNISNLFGMYDDTGLSDITISDMSLNDAIQECKTEKKLFILPSGKTSLQSPDLLALNKVKKLLEKAEENYDIILIDSPSVNISVDTVILSTVSDATVLICEAGQTKIEDVKSGKEKLERVKSSVPYMILKTKDLKEYEYVDIY